MLWHKMIGPLPKADLKIVTNTSYPAVEPKKRSEEWKKTSSAKIWRFDWRWRQKGWGMNTTVSMCRGVVSIHSSPAILFVCAYAPCSLCYTGFQTVYDVLFYLLVSQSQDGSATLEHAHMRSPWTSDHWHATCTFTLSNPTFHTHFSIVTVVSQIHSFFNQKTCIPLVKINSHNQKTELSAGHLNLGANMTPQDFKIPIAFLW